MSTSIIVTLYERVKLPAGHTLVGVVALACEVGIVTIPTANRPARHTAPRWRADSARRAGQAIEPIAITAALINNAAGRSIKNSASIETGKAGTAPRCAA